MDKSILTDIGDLPANLVVGTMCHCNDPEDDHWEFFILHDQSHYDPDTGYLSRAYTMDKAQMEAVARLVNSVVGGRSDASD